MTSIQPTDAGQRLFSLRRVALVVIPLVIFSAAAAAVAIRRIDHNAKRSDEQAMLKWFEMASPSPRLLDPRFHDSDADLIADSPSDPAQQLSPQTLSFSYVGGADASAEAAAWQDFASHLETITQKKVELKAFESTRDQLSALAKGELHVTAFNTGAVPTAVASCGFVPICTLGHDDGKFGLTMRIVVPAKSPIRSIKDLKGRTIAFTTRDSNSGCKAALALLREFDLLPLRDYLWKFSGGHDASIEGVAKGYYQAAPVASDLLERALAKGDVNSADIRTVYESEKFPPATAGCVYYLSPELREQVRKAFLEFDWHETALAKQFEAQGVVKFVPISYKQDFALIRRLDDAFRNPLSTAGN